MPAPSPQSGMLIVEPDSAGQRLDNFLMRHLKGVPKTHVYRIIRSGEVRINKGRAAADVRVQAGDQLRLPPLRLSPRAGEKAHSMAVERAGPGSTAARRGFAVLLEDEHLLAINKPAGVAVHGGSGVSFGVIEQLRMARPQAPFLELVHRLDRETSGVLLLAKKRSALKHLQDQFRERETGKTYLALVLGNWPENKKVLDKPLHKYLLPAKDGQAEGERRVKVVAKGDPDGMPALTVVKLRASTAPDAAQPYSLLEVTLKTGRTHQIRVHLASEGMPIAGDDKYGNFDANRLLARTAGPGGLKRMFLHAWCLACNHPATGERMQLQAELPGDLSTFVRNVLPQLIQPSPHARPSPPPV
ncbi:MAG: RluA family pseudouridine synthase [Rhodoferax sp.]|nr:RluA family pseudouridine synthase [Rhodoferax sp.]